VRQHPLMDTKVMLRYRDLVGRVALASERQPQTFPT
jgi:hypothetical protein